MYILTDNIWTSGYITLSLTLIFCFVILCFIFFVYNSYKKIRTPEPFFRNTVSSKLNCKDIATSYLLFTKNTDLATEISLTPTHPFQNYKKNKFIINDMPLMHPPYQLTGLGLDYVLGRMFLAVKQKNKDSDFAFYKLIAYVLPWITLSAFALFSFLNITLFVIHEVFPNFVANQNILNFIYNYKILFICLLTLFFLYFLFYFYSYSIKVAIENSYEEHIREFVKTNYLDLYSDFLVARRYSRSIKHPYCLGFGFLLKSNYLNLGPFGY